MMRRGALVLGTFLLAAAVAVVATAAWLRTRVPLASLPRDDPAALAVTEELPEAWHGRTLLHVVLEGPAVGRVRFVVSLPDPLPPRRLPVVVILGGLGGGSRSIRELSDVVGDPGPNAFVGYDWPLPAQEPTVGDVLRQLPAFRRGVLSVPGQVDAIVAWAAGRPWADGGRVSLLGLSLGAFVVPASQRLVQDRGGAIGWTGIGYAGSPIGAVIAGHPGAGPAPVRRVLGAAADLLLRPVEPGNYLPQLHGRFLVLEAASDRLIAQGAADRLAALTPEPRTIVRIAGDHMGVGRGKRDVLDRVVEATRGWLVEEGAIDAPPPRPASALPAR